ncbi:MAG: dTDP-4-dehydrorhamnose reductase [bacterium]
MKLLILGAEGQLGKVFYSSAHAKGLDVSRTFERPREGCPGLDLAKPQSIPEIFKKTRPDAVVLCGAMTYVDGCEDNPDLARRINAEGAGAVAENCARSGARLVFLSTEYVFDGKNGPYSEEDFPNPLSVYGKTKLEGETLVLGGGNNLVIRTTVVYSWDPGGNNFVMQLIDGLSKGETIRVPNDQISTPTYAPELAGIILRLLELGKSGIYNVTGRDVLDRYEFGVKACNVLCLDPRLLVPVSTAELKQKAPRPLNAGLKTDKLIRETGIIPGTAQQGLEMLRTLADGSSPFGGPPAGGMPGKEQKA